MIKLEEIEIKNYKNLDYVKIDFTKSRIINIVGINGIGKSNILEAIYFFGYYDKKKYEKRFSERDFDSYNIDSKYLFGNSDYSNLKKYINRIDMGIFHDIIFLYKTFKFYDVLNLNLKFDWKELFVTNKTEFTEKIFQDLLNPFLFSDNYLFKKSEVVDFLNKLEEKEFLNKEKNNLKRKISKNNSKFFPSVSFKIKTNLSDYDLIEHDIDTKKNSSNQIDKKIEFYKNLIFTAFLSGHTYSPSCNYFFSFYKNDGNLRKKSQSNIFDWKNMNDLFESFAMEKINFIFESNFKNFFLRNVEYLSDKNSVLRKIIIFLNNNDESIIEKIKISSSWESDQLLSEINNKISDFLFSDWSNEKLRLNIKTLDLSNLKFEIYIESLDKNEKPIKNRYSNPEDFSSGHLWHIAIKTLFSQINKNKPTVILLDEPYNYLHIDSQKNLIKFLDNFVKNNENIYLIYTTHSPFFISEKASYLSFNENINKWIFSNDLKEFEKNNKNFKTLIKSNELKIIEILNNILNFNISDNVWNNLEAKHYNDAIINVRNQIIFSLIRKLNFNLKKSYSTKYLFKSFFEKLEKNELNNKLQNLLDNLGNFLSYIRNNETDAHIPKNNLSKELYEQICILGLVLSNIIDKIEFKKESFNHDNETYNLQQESLKS